MKKGLYFILLTTFMAQMPSESTCMKRSISEISSNPNETSKSKSSEERKAKRRKLETEAQAQEVAQIADQIQKFDTGEATTAEGTNTYKSLHWTDNYCIELKIKMKLPVLHFLAKEGNKYSDALESFKYFVEQKHADINQKIVLFTAPNGSLIETYRFGIHNCETFKNEDRNAYTKHAKLLTPLEVAEMYDNKAIAEYLRGKMAEQEAARIATETTITPETPATPKPQTGKPRFLGNLFGWFNKKK
jgi:hypothetical protein